jgi:hypothetical protein
VLGQQLDQPDVVGKDVHWPTFDFREDSLVEILNLERHGGMLASLLTIRRALRQVGPFTTGRNYALSFNGR